MEEKFTQIKLNVGSAKDASVDSAPIEEDKVEKDSLLNDPETIPMDIAENRQSAPMDEEISLVSPDEAIFTMVAENVNETQSGSRAVDWHDTNADSEDDFVVDDERTCNGCSALFTGDRFVVG